jgi:hypothetical protein
MNPDLQQLVAAFGAPAALMIWLIMQSRAPKSDPAPDPVLEKLDELKEVIHGMDTRLTKVETILEERDPPKARR